MGFSKRIQFSAAVLMCQLLLTSTAITVAQNREIKVRGFITSISSPTSFEIADYRVTRDQNVPLEFQDAGPDVTFRSEDFRVGTEVEIRGIYNEQTGALQARKIKIDLDQFRKLKQTVVLSSTPESLERVGESWRAMLFAGGRKIRIEPTTKIEFQLSGIEQEYLKQSAKQKDADGKFHALSSLEEVGPGILMTFEGVPAPDGTVTAERVEFRRNEREKNEEGLWKLYKAKVKTPKDQANKPSTLRIAFSLGNVDLRLLPQDVQDYVSKVGNSLVPAYQRALPDSDPTKIPFQFFVIERKDAFTLPLPNGTIIVTSGMLDVLENEAQLASLLAREIAHIVQKHSLRQWVESMQKRLSLALGRLNSFSNLNQAQADRLSLEYLLLAGYDLNEAPRAWKMIAGKNPEREDTITRRSSLMIVLQNNYSQLDTSRLRKNEEEFKQILKRVREAVSVNQAKQKT